MVKVIVLLGVLGMGVFALISWESDKQTEKWVAPKSADMIKNPYRGNTTATIQGKKLFMQFCLPCHGSRGKGDGIAGVNLKPRPASFMLSAIQQQTDGAIFWKLTNGKPPMASYQHILKDEQRWQLVNYIRELGKPKK